MPCAHDQHGHRLYHCPQWGAWLCQACGKRTATIGSRAFGCSEGCDFLACPECVALPGCKGEHVLITRTPSFPTNPQIQQWCCDRCKRLYPLTAKSRGCRLCDYDVCMACVEEERRCLQTDERGYVHYVHSTGVKYNVVLPPAPARTGDAQADATAAASANQQSIAPVKIATAPTSNTGTSAPAILESVASSIAAAAAAASSFFTGGGSSAAPSPVKPTGVPTPAPAMPWAAGGNLSGGGGGGTLINNNTTAVLSGGVKLSSTVGGNYNGTVLVTEPTTGRMRALFIGINYFRTAAELNGCINDVAVMMNLVQALGFDITERRVLVDDRSFPGRTGHPTRKEMVEAMKWLVADMKPGDHSFLHFSGHGAQVKAPEDDSDEEDGLTETLVPVDYLTSGQLADDDIFKMIAAPLPAGARLTAITDCCHSGDVCDLEFTWTWQDAARSKGYFKQARNGKRHIAGDMVAITGCESSQTSADVSNVADFKNKFTQGAPGNSGGACTNALAEVVGQRINREKKCASVDFVELLKLMQENLKRRKFTQTPQLVCSKNMRMDADFSLFGALPA